MWEFFHILFLMFFSNIAAGVSEAGINLLFKRKDADMFGRIYWVLFPMFSLFVVGWNISNGTLGEYDFSAPKDCQWRFC